MSNEHEDCAHKKAIKGLQNSCQKLKDYVMAGFVKTHGKLSVVPVRKDGIRDVDLSRLDGHLCCIYAQDPEVQISQNIAHSQNAPHSHSQFFSCSQNATRSQNGTHSQMINIL